MTAKNYTREQKQLEIAKEIQQDKYELMPGWIMYEAKDYEYLVQNIGFSMYGLPKNENAEVQTAVKFDSKKYHVEAKLTDTISYGQEQQKNIDRIFNVIRNHGEGYESKKAICSEIIYNVFLLKDDEQKKIKSALSNTKAEEENDDFIGIGLTPIFSIKKTHDFEINNFTDKVWYIDINGRVYKTWNDYKDSNTLPECTMVLPKDGLYQPDITESITDEYSTVWLEILDSPACRDTATAITKIDKISSGASLVALGVGVASLFTPVGPVLAAGAAFSGGASGLWTFGRSTQQLIDRNKHEQSISPLNLETLPAWIGIAGTSAGAAAAGSATLIKKAAERGLNISLAARVAYNTAMFSCLGINTCGILFQVYNMYENYQTNNEIDPFDVVLLGTHVLFLSNAVINFQFAGDLIESTQGRVLDDFKKTLRSKNMRKKFNRVKRMAAMNNQDPFSERAEVIRHINTKQEFARFKMNNLATSRESAADNRHDPNNENKQSTANNSKNPNNVNDPKKPSTTNNSKNPNNVNDPKQPSTTNNSKNPNNVNDPKQPSTTNNSKNPNNVNDPKKPSTTNNSKNLNNVNDPKKPSIANNSKNPNNANDPKNPSNIDNSKNPTNVNDPKKPSTANNSKNLNNVNDPKQPSTANNSKNPNNANDPKNPSNIDNSKNPTNVNDPKKPSTANNSKNPNNVNDPKNPSNIDNSKNPNNANDPKNPSNIDNSKNPNNQKKPSTTVSSKNPNNANNSQNPKANTINLQNLNNTNYFIHVTAYNFGSLMLLKPIIFAEESENLDSNASKFSPTAQNNDNDECVILALRSMLPKLLTKLYSNKYGIPKYPQITLPTTIEFEPILQELRYLDFSIAKNILQKIFKIVKAILKRYCPLVPEHIFDLVDFIWKYAKMNLKIYCDIWSSTFSNLTMQKYFNKIINIIEFNEIQDFNQKLYDALKFYLQKKYKCT